MATVEFNIPKTRFFIVSTAKFNTCKIQYLRKLLPLSLQMKKAKIR